MRLCNRRSHIARNSFRTLGVIGAKIASQNPAMMPILLRTKKEGNMFKKLLGAAAMAAVAFAVVPAHAAKMGGGCSGANLEKTESTLDTMADGESKITAQKEIAAAQDAMLSGKMGVCGMHLAKAMRAEGSK
jgi:predicted aconitase